MLVSNVLLLVFLAHQAWFWSSLEVNKTLALNFSISTSKIHLAEEPSLNSDLEAGAPYAGARAAELEEAKGTSDDIDGVVGSAQANRVPAGPGFLMFSSVGCSDILFALADWPAARVCAARIE